MPVFYFLNSDKNEKGKQILYKTIDAGKDTLFDETNIVIWIKQTEF